MVAATSGHRVVLFACLGAVTCFALRMAGIRWNLSLPPLPYQSRLES